MSPRTRVLALCGAVLLAVGVPGFLAACGKPPAAPGQFPRFGTPSSGADPSGLDEALNPGYGMPSGTAPGGMMPPPGGAVMPTVGQPGPLATTRVAIPTTRSPGPSPAPRCTPTQLLGAQVIELIKGHEGIPDKTLRVDKGPYCSDQWSFTTVVVAGETADQDPLAVVAFGPGSSLQLVAAGSDVCNKPVRTGAPPAVRVLACGF